MVLPQIHPGCFLQRSNGGEGFDFFFEKAYS
jgi:hypothetical protein